MGIRFCGEARYVQSPAAILVLWTRKLKVSELNFAAVSGDQVTLVHVISNPRASGADSKRGI